MHPLSSIQSPWLKPLPAVLLRETPANFQLLKEVNKDLEEIKVNNGHLPITIQLADAAQKLLEFLQDYKTERNKYGMQLKNDLSIDRQKYSELSERIARFLEQLVLEDSASAEERDFFLQISFALKFLAALCKADAIVNEEDPAYEQTNKNFEKIIAEVNETSLDNVIKATLHAGHISFLLTFSSRNEALTQYRAVEKNFTEFLNTSTVMPNNQNYVVSGIASTVANLLRKNRTGDPLHDDKKRFEEALPYYQKAKKNNPGTNIIANNLAICLSKIGGKENLLEAVKIFDEVIGRDPDKNLLVAPLYKARALIQLSLLTNDLAYANQAVELLDLHAAVALEKGASYSEEYRNYGWTRVFKAKAEAKIALGNSAEGSSQSATSKKLSYYYAQSITSFIKLSKISEKKYNKMEDLQRKVTQAVPLSEKEAVEAATEDLVQAKAKFSKRFF